MRREQLETNLVTPLPASSGRNETTIKGVRHEEEEREVNQEKEPFVV